MPLLRRVGWLRLAHFRVQFAWGLPHVINVYTRKEAAHTVFLQQYMALGPQSLLDAERYWTFRPQVIASVLQRIRSIHRLPGSSAAWRPHGVRGRLSLLHLACSLFCLGQKQTVQLLGNTKLKAKSKLNFHFQGLWPSQFWDEFKWELCMSFDTIETSLTPLPQPKGNAKQRLRTDPNASRAFCLKTSC